MLCGEANCWSFRWLLEKLGCWREPCVSLCNHPQQQQGCQASSTWYDPGPNRLALFLVGICLECSGGSPGWWLYGAFMQLASLPDRPCVRKLYFPLKSFLFVPPQLFKPLPLSPFRADREIKPLPSFSHPPRFLDGIGLAVCCFPPFGRSTSLLRYRAWDCTATEWLLLGHEWAGGSWTLLISQMSFLCDTLQVAWTCRQQQEGGKSLKVKCLSLFLSGWSVWQRWANRVGKTRRIQ